MNDKKQAKIEIINYLCGDEDLSEEFTELLKAGNLTQEDGKTIRNNLIGQLDSNYNFDLLFSEYYMDQLKDNQDYPAEEIRKYPSDEEFWNCWTGIFPKPLMRRSIQ